MLRFRLILNQEETNIFRTFNILGRTNAMPAADTDAAAKARARFKEILSSPVSLYSGTARPSAQQVLDDWINGDFFHVNQASRKSRESYEFAKEANLSLHSIVGPVRELINVVMEVDALLEKNGLP